MDTSYEQRVITGRIVDIDNGLFGIRPIPYDNVYVKTDTGEIVRISFWGRVPRSWIGEDALYIAGPGRGQHLATGDLHEDEKTVGITLRDRSILGIPRKSKVDGSPPSNFHLNDYVVAMG